MFAWIVGATGWTWETVERCLTIPQLNAMNAHWAAVPPPCIQLKRISLALGLPDTKPAAPSRPTSERDALQEARSAGLPVMEGRPDDPMLDLVGW